MRFVGTWRVVSSAAFEDDYLRMEVEPFVQLRRDGERLLGEYHVGLQSGSLDGRLGDEEHATFSFEGNDELDEVNGAATATLTGDRMLFTLMYRCGDDFTFECERR